MHVNLKFDATEAEWFGEISLAPKQPPFRVFPAAPHQHNVPLSIVVGCIQTFWPGITIDIEMESLIAYRMYKAMRS